MAFLIILCCAIVALIVYVWVEKKYKTSYKRDPELRKVRSLADEYKQIAFHYDARAYGVATEFGMMDKFDANRGKMLQDILDNASKGQTSDEELTPIMLYYVFGINNRIEQIEGCNNRNVTIAKKQRCFSIIKDFPISNERTLQEYVDFVVELCGATSENQMEEIIADYRTTKKREDNISVEEWADSVVEYITSQNLKYVLQNDLTLLDFVLYWYFNCYVAFCKIVQDQEKSTEYSNQFREWYAEYTEKKGLERNFAEELYWNRIEGYNEIMMSDSNDKDGALINAIEQFMKKSRLDTPFEKAMVIGNFMETFEMNAEIAHLYRDTGKATDDKFKEICEFFKNCV